MKHSIIPLFIPHYGCPHQCVFCSQVRITGHTTPVTPEEVSHTISRYLSMVEEERYWEAAFYGGSFTALPLPVMEALLRPASEALWAGKIQGIRLSTRPDCISGEKLELLGKMGVSTVELGVQSLSDEVLRRAERGHTAMDAAQAVSLLRQYGFQVGLQFMVGLPGETMAILRRSAREGVRLHPDFIRLYPVLVLEDTKLAAMYRNGTYMPLSMKEAVFRCAYLKRWYEKHHVSVIRTGLQATEELDRGTSCIAGPYHAAMGELAEQYIWRHALLRALRGFPYGEEISILCNRRDRSRLMGHRRGTWILLQKQWGPRIQCGESESCRIGEVRIQGGGKSFQIIPI